MDLYIFGNLGIKIVLLRFHIGENRVVLATEDGAFIAEGKSLFWDYVELQKRISYYQQVS